MSAKDTGKQIIDLSRKAKHFLFSKESFVFLLLLALSVLLWFFNKAGHEQFLTAHVAIDYKGIPGNIEIHGQLPKAIEVTFVDKGTSFFSYLAKNELLPVQLDLTGRFSSSGQIAIHTKVFEKQIVASLKSTASQIHLLPDSIIINYSMLSKKTVPVRFSGSILPARQYIVSKDVVLTPANVDVYGKKEILDTLSAVNTESVVVKDANDSVDMPVRLQPVKGLHTSRDKIQLRAGVEMFTEKTMEIPIRVINVPEHYLLHAFPVTVKVIAQVGMSEYKYLEPQDVQAIVDYNTIMLQSDSDKAKVVLKSDKYDLERFRVVPEKVDVLLEKKR